MLSFSYQNWNSSIDSLVYAIYGGVLILIYSLSLSLSRSSSVVVMRTAPIAFLAAGVVGDGAVLRYYGIDRYYYGFLLMVDTLRFLLSPFFFLTFSFNYFLHYL